MRISKSRRWLRKTSKSRGWPGLVGCRGCGGWSGGPDNPPYFYIYRWASNQNITIERLLWVELWGYPFKQFNRSWHWTSTRLLTPLPWTSRNLPTVVQRAQLSPWCCQVFFLSNILDHFSFLSPPSPPFAPGLSLSLSPSLSLSSTRARARSHTNTHTHTSANFDCLLHCSCINGRFPNSNIYLLFLIITQIRLNQVTLASIKYKHKRQYW